MCCGQLKCIISGCSLFFSVWNVAPHLIDFQSPALDEHIQGFVPCGSYLSISKVDIGTIATDVRSTGLVKLRLQPYVLRLRAGKKVLQRTSSFRKIWSHLQTAVPHHLQLLHPQLFTTLQRHPLLPNVLQRVVPHRGAQADDNVHPAVGKSNVLKEAPVSVLYRGNNDRLDH